jgi:hypothetical protein
VIRACLIVAVLAGCSTTKTTVSSRVDLAGTTPFDRLVVFAEVEREGFPPLMYTGFRMTMTSLLRDCAVTAKVVSGRYISLEEDDIRSQMEQLQPTARLSIGPTGGTKTIEHIDRTEYGDVAAGSEHQMYFELELFDMRANKATWIAKTELGFHSGGSYESGADFAISLVTQLRTDGVLTRCPRGELKRPANPR